MRAVFLSLAACLAVAFAVYAGSLRGPFIFDDLGQIVENPDIRKLENLKTKLLAPYDRETPYNRNDPSRPMAYLTFTLNHHLGGLDPWGFRLFNVVLHGLCACLVFLLARRVARSAGAADPVGPALLAALFFAVHPLQTEVVTYIYHRSESLAMLFFLASILCFDAAGSRPLPWGTASLAAFMLALSAKQTAATLPAILLLYDFAVLGHPLRGLWERRWRHLPYWLVFAAYLAFRYFHLGGIGDRETDAYARWTSLSYLSVEPSVILRYLGLLAFPSGLCVDHVVDPPRSYLAAGIWVPALALAGMAAWTLRALRRPGTDRPLAFCAAWFLITLSPTSSFLPILDAMAERRLYLPGFGFHLALALTYFRVFRPEGKGARSRGRTLMLIAAMHLAALSVATLARNKIYRDPLTFWQAAVASYPRNARAQNNLANAYYERGSMDDALRHYLQAVSIDPAYAGSYTNLGNIYLARGDDANAFAWYKKAVETNPAIAGLHVNLGNIYYRRGEADRALAEFRQAAELDPNYAEARYSMGLALEAKKDFAAARAAYQAALDLKADLPDAHNNLGRLLFLSGRHADAEASYRRALGLQPGNAGAHYNLGLLYEAMGRRAAALAEYREALRLEPANAWAARRVSALGGAH